MKNATRIALVSYRGFFEAKGNLFPEARVGQIQRILERLDEGSGWKYYSSVLVTLAILKSAKLWFTARSTGPNEWRAAKQAERLALAQWLCFLEPGLEEATAVVRVSELAKLV